MPRSRVEFYYHLVWATRRREPFLTPEIERRVYRCIQSEVERLGGTVLAINGLADHVHLAVTAPGVLGPSEIVKRAKGTSSRFAKEGLRLTETLYWQEGYNGYSISRSHLSRVMAYVKNQKQRHADGTLWPEWEPDDE